MSHGQHGQRWKFTSFSIQKVARPIGGFTVTSFDVSHGRLASLVGKRSVVAGLRVYFAGIHSLSGLHNKHWPAGPPAICNRRASDMQLLLARRATNFFFFFFSFFLIMFCM